MTRQHKPGFRYEDCWCSKPSSEGDTKVENPKEIKGAIHVAIAVVDYFYARGLATPHGLLTAITRATREAENLTNQPEAVKLEVGPIVHYMTDHVMYHSDARRCDCKHETFYPKRESLRETGLRLNKILRGS